MRMLLDRILVKPKEKVSITPGGIHLPDTAKEKPVRGSVVQVGPGRRNDTTGEHMPVLLSPGDTVLYGRYAGSETKIKDEEYIVLHEADVLAVFEPEDEY
jgi:chaperonin GroES